MKRLHLLTLLGLLTAAAACSSDKTQSPPAVAQIALSHYDLVFEVGEQVTLEAVVAPADAAYSVNDFQLRTANGGEPAWVLVTTRQSLNSQTVRFALLDNRPQQRREAYDETVVLCHAPTGVASEPLRLRSAVHPEVTGLSLSLAEGRFRPGEQLAVEVTATPGDTRLTAGEFRLTTDAGEAPEYLRIADAEQLAPNQVRLVIADCCEERNPQSYDETFCVEHIPSGVRSEPFRARSQAFLPVVRLTTQVKQSSITKNTWVDGTIAIEGGGLCPDLDEMATQVKGRGNSTWGWEKKPYALKLDKKQAVMGMPKHKRWCLIANYMDRTHLRNRLAYYLAANTRLAWTPRNEYVELFFNGAYQGCYLLTEQIKEDENRVDITEMEPTDNDGEAVTGGYLLEFDTNFDEEKRFRTTATNIPVNLKYPDPEDVTDAQFAYIRQYMNEADAAVAAVAHGGDPEEAFRYIDRESMIEFWIVFEVMANHEVLHPKSVYFHKDRNGKLVAGPVWDFDYETLVASQSRLWVNYGMRNNPTHYPWYDRTWWNILLMNDASFRADVKQRWQELYPFLQTLPAFIEAERERIAPAVARNAGRWPAINGTGHPNQDETLSFDDAVARLASTLTTRIEWLNSQIARW